MPNQIAFKKRRAWVVWDGKKENKVKVQYGEMLAEGLDI